MSTDTAQATTPVGRVTRRERWSRIIAVLGSLQGYIGLVLVLLFGIISKGSQFLDQTNLTNAVGTFASRGIRGGRDPGHSPPTSICPSARCSDWRR